MSALIPCLPTRRYHILCILPQSLSLSATVFSGVHSCKVTLLRHFAEGPWGTTLKLLELTLSYMYLYATAPDSPFGLELERTWPLQRF